MTEPDDRVFQATDSDVIAWTVQHYLDLAPDPGGAAPFLVSTGEDLETLVAAAAEQVDEHHDPVHGQAEHLITCVYVWPLLDRDYDEVLITVSTHPLLGTRLATDSLGIHTFRDSEHTTTEASVAFALTGVLEHARQVVKAHRGLMIDPELARRISAWTDTWRDHQAATEDATSLEQEPPATIDHDLNAEALLLDIDLGLGDRGISTRRPSAAGTATA